MAVIFSDNMILQQNKPVHFWGEGIPGKTVTVSFADEIKKVVVKADSSWSVYFDKQIANIKPQVVTVQSIDEKIELKNILIGDIWICSGQSNMEWEMQKEMHWKEEKHFSNQPIIRFTNPPPVGRYVYRVAYNDSLNRRLAKDSLYLWNGWKVCDSSTIKTMSAVAYYFAKSIAKETNIPIGLINLSIGGAPAETFISADAMQHSKQFASKVNGNWLANESLPVWVRERGAQNIGNNLNGYKGNMKLNHAYKPGFAYECGIRPLLSFAIKGILWYQGESNAQETKRVEEYAALCKLMVEDYRQKWRQTRLPFYYVQLSSIDTVKYKGQWWPLFRDEQRKMLALIPNSGMAVCSDIGVRNDVHPTNKKDVGERLARWALSETYNRTIVPSGPLPLQAAYKNRKVTVTFQYTANGLRTSDGKTLQGFSLDGKNEVKAEIVRNTIVIYTDDKPRYVYYGWKPFSGGNLVNNEMLPTSTFKLDVQ
ncbi:MAG: sialate O-acetylesterase [Bacteroidetes bacterium]|nr:sialate O-acetylesterase [Bacteroidota bacterium]